MGDNLECSVVMTNRPDLDSEIPATAALLQTVPSRVWFSNTLQTASFFTLRSMIPYKIAPCFSKLSNFKICRSTFN